MKNPGYWYECTFTVDESDFKILVCWHIRRWAVKSIELRDHSGHTMSPLAVNHLPDRIKEIIDEIRPKLTREGVKLNES